MDGLLFNRSRFWQILPIANKSQIQTEATSMANSSDCTPDKLAWLNWLEKYAQATERTIKETQDALEKVRKKRDRERRRDTDGLDDTTPFETEN